MRRTKIFLPVIIVCLSFTLTAFLYADEEEGTFSGKFLFGYRAVSTTGELFKYKEDINLDDGVRLFNLSLHYIPGGNLKKLMDRLDLNVYNFGGDPFETFGLSIQKYGRYKFRYDRKKAAYFYHDQHREGGELYDLHTFDFERRIDSGCLNIFLGKNVDFYLNFDRYTKKGESVTTFDISRIEFEMNKPIDEDAKLITLGVKLHVKRYSLLLEEKIQEYNNVNSLFLPGYADGGEGARYPSALYYFDSSQPYDLKTYTHSAKFNATPLNNLFLSGSFQTSKQSMDLTYSEDAEGINYLGQQFEYSFSGSGSFERKIQLYDLDVTYLLFNRLALVGAVRYHNFDQSGSMDVGLEDEYFSEDSTLSYNTLGFEGGVQYQVSSGFALTAGYRCETRTLDNIETVTYEFKTRRNGYFGNLKWNLLKKLKLTLDYQRGDFSDPLTLIGPTSFDRFRATAKLRMSSFVFSGSYLWTKSTSEIYTDTWISTRNQFNLRAGYHTKNIRISGGYSYIDIERSGDRTVWYPPSWSGPAGTFLWEILYEGKSSLIDAVASLNFTENWRLGGYANCYTNKGFWEISRKMVKAYLEYVFECGIAAQVGYRFADFKEKLSGYNDYKANIFEFSFGYRWK